MESAQEQAEDMAAAPLLRNQKAETPIGHDDAGLVFLARGLQKVCGGCDVPQENCAACAITVDFETTSTSTNLAAQAT